MTTITTITSTPIISINNTKKGSILYMSPIDIHKPHSIHQPMVAAIQPKQPFASLIFIVLMLKSQ